MALYKKDNQNSLAGLLPDMMDEKGWLKQLDLYSIFPKWLDLVGGDLATYARPLKIERGVLWLEVENSAWLQQFQYEKIELLEVLNRHLRLNSLKDVKMVLPKGKAENDDADKLGDGNNVVFEKPSQESVAAFERQIESIADEKCRDALMRFWYLSQACKRK